ncbi:MAG: hypothetical protein OES20_12685 [Gammaproteobacteria bacterium]|nr:hypothetical protein [Gammaproteobacteria bacterium]
MKSKTMKTYRTALGSLLLPALRLSGLRKQNPTKTFKVKRPAGSVAPLY